MQPPRGPAQQTYEQLYTELTQDHPLPDFDAIERIILSSQALSRDVARLHSNDRQDSLLHTALLYNVHVRIVELLVQHFPLMLYAVNQQGHIPLHLGVLVHSTKALAYTLVWERFYRQYDGPSQNSLPISPVQLFRNLDQSLLFLGRQCSGANKHTIPPEMVYDAIEGKCELETVECILQCNPSAANKVHVAHNPSGTLIHWALSRMPQDSEYDLGVLRLILDYSEERAVLEPPALQIALCSPNTPKIVKMLVQEHEEVVNTPQNVLYAALSTRSPSLEQGLYMLEEADEKTMAPLLRMILRSLPPHLEKYGTAIVERLVQRFPRAVSQQEPGGGTALHVLLYDNYCRRAIAPQQHTQVLALVCAFIQQCPGVLFVVDDLGFSPLCLVSSANNVQDSASVREVCVVLREYELSLSCPSYTAATRSVSSDLVKSMWGGSDTRDVYSLK